MYSRGTSQLTSFLRPKHVSMDAYGPGLSLKSDIHIRGKTPSAKRTIRCSQQPCASEWVHLLKSYLFAELRHEDMYTGCHTFVRHQETFLYVIYRHVADSYPRFLPNLCADPEVNPLSVFPLETTSK